MVVYYTGRPEPFRHVCGGYSYIIILRVYLLIVYSHTKFKLNLQIFVLFYFVHLLHYISFKTKTSGHKNSFFPTRPGTPQQHQLSSRPMDTTRYINIKSYFTYFNCLFYIYDFYSACFIFSYFVYFDCYAPQHQH